jgi:hypothetical protein
LQKRQLQAAQVHLEAHAHGHAVERGLEAALEIEESHTVTAVHVQSLQDSPGNGVWAFALALDLGGLAAQWRRHPAANNTCPNLSPQAVSRSSRACAFARPPRWVDGGVVPGPPTITRTIAPRHISAIALR